MTTSSRGQTPYEAALAAARETAHVTDWTDCSPLEKQVLLEDAPYPLLQTRQQVAKELIAAFPQEAQQIRKALMPTAPVRKTAHATSQFTPKQSRILADIAEENERRRHAIAKAFAAGEANARALIKAKSSDKEPMVAVYDADGNLVGMIEPDAITEIAQPKAADAQDAAPTDLTPAPAGSVGTPADAVPTATAKAMSRGAEQHGAHQLGGPHPRGGFPIVSAQDASDLDQALTKAAAHGAELKKQFGPNSGASAAEQVRAGTQLDALAYAAISATLGRRRGPR